MNIAAYRSRIQRNRNQRISAVGDRSNYRTDYFE